jgi:hypothetical protein
MSENTVLRDLFDRWEQVWHEERFDLVPDCVGSHYVRHDEAGDRTVSRDAYAAEIAKVQQERPGSVSSSMIIRSKAIVRGSASLSSGQIWLRERLALERACRPTGRREASSSKRGFRCNPSARRGRIRHKSTGQAVQRSSNAAPLRARKPSAGSVNCNQSYFRDRLKSLPSYWLTMCRLRFVTGNVKAIATVIEWRSENRA